MHMKHNNDSLALGETSGTQSKMLRILHQHSPKETQRIVTERQNRSAEQSLKRTESIYLLPSVLNYLEIILSCGFSIPLKA